MCDPIPLHPRQASPHPASQVSYLFYAEAALAAAAASPDAAARALHEQECALWLILARERRAIEAVVTRLAQEPDAVVSRSPGATA